MTRLRKMMLEGLQRRNENPTRLALRELFVHHLSDDQQPSESSGPHQVLGLNSS
jgi:hypothetical protein